MVEKQREREREHKRAETVYHDDKPTPMLTTLTYS
jgi:hypothetical protein